jgi:hypothetical protein
VQDESARWIALWEDYNDPADASLGTGIILDPTARFAGFAETPNDRLLLVKVKPGETVRYYVGGGWSRTGDFSSADDWKKYLGDFAVRLKSPLKITYSAP